MLKVVIVALCISVGPAQLDCGVGPRMEGPMPALSCEVSARAVKEFVEDLAEEQNPGSTYVVQTKCVSPDEMMSELQQLLEDTAEKIKGKREI